MYHFVGSEAYRADTVIFMTVVLTGKFKIQINYRILNDFNPFINGFTLHIAGNYFIITGRNSVKHVPAPVSGIGLEIRIFQPDQGKLQLFVPSIYPGCYLARDRACLAETGNPEELTDYEKNFFHLVYSER